MKHLFREPLVHFIILGGLLFAGHSLWQRHVSKADYTITVSPDEMERQATIFAGENRRQPTDEDLQALLFAYVEEQALMREASRMGLGDDDTIIRRRLAQKMRFMIEDVDPPKQPDEATLETWFNANVNKFVKPETRSFSHIYFSPEKHGKNLNVNLEKVRGIVDEADWESLGDPFMLKREFTRLSTIDVSRLFGADFAAGVFNAETTGWQGPIDSAFGRHLVRIDATTPKIVPKLEDVRAAVIREWQDESQRAANTQRLKDLIQKYKVVVEDVETQDDEAQESKVKDAE